MGLFDKIFGNYSKKELAKIEPIKNKVLELESKYADMSDEELGGQTAILRASWTSFQLLMTFFLTLLRFAVKLRSECLAKSLTLFR